MTLVKSLIWQTSTSTGTGNLTLVHKSGYRDFNAFGTGATPDVFYYFIEDVTNDAWEIGTGHMSNATTLVRDTVIESSNANAAVNFLGGTLQVVNDIRAMNQADITQAQTWTGAQTFNAVVLGQLPTGAGVSNVSTGSTLASRDAAGNTGFNNFFASTANITASATPVSLTYGSSRYQKVTGSTTQVINLPNATTLVQSWEFEINNNTTASNVSVYLNDTTTLLVTVPAGGYGWLINTSNGTTNGTWDYHPALPSGVSWGSAGLPLATAGNVSGQLPLTNGGTARTDGLSQGTVSGVVTGAMMAGTGAARSVGIVITGGTAVVPTGAATAQIVVPFTGTISKWYAAADQSGSIVVDVLRSGTSIIGAGNKPTLSSAQSANAAPTSWTSTAVTQGDILTFNVTSSTTVTSINITLLCTVT